ncbi:MerR family transcriptional regulator [Actinoplanes solisilvae]|uniref:MerR family transcriptional regulator n=1 Tax=Actinoplanes solisilvae TaxID=2486853 RepID=UPI000FD9A9B3|nr:MerR family transcriptional regulator [Actinoplanes solisilvae]
MRVGELSRTTGVSTRALRYYDQQGLLRATRTANGYRDYGDQAPDVVSFIQDMFQAGLPSEVIRDILPCAVHDESYDEDDCDALMARVQAVRDELLRQEDRLRSRRETLDDYLGKIAAGEHVGKLPA